MAMLSYKNRKQQIYYLKVGTTQTGNAFYQAILRFLLVDKKKRLFEEYF